MTVNLYSLATNNACTASVAQKLDRVGLLQFRIVRWLLGINLDKFVKKLNTKFAANLEGAAELQQQFENLLSKKWKVRKTKLDAILKIEKDQIILLTKSWLRFDGPSDQIRETVLSKINSSEIKAFTVQGKNTRDEKVVYENVPAEVLESILSDSNFNSWNELFDDHPVKLQEDKTVHINGFVRQILLKTCPPLEAEESEEEVPQRENLEYPLTEEAFNYIVHERYNPSSSTIAFKSQTVTSVLEYAINQNNEDLKNLCIKNIRNYLNSTGCSFDNVVHLLSFVQKLDDDGDFSWLRIACEAFISNALSNSSDSREYLQTILNCENLTIHSLCLKSTGKSISKENLGMIAQLHLKKLDLVGYSDLDFTEFAQYANIEHLGLIELEINDASFKNLCAKPDDEPTALAQHLKSLDLRKCSQLTDEILPEGIFLFTQLEFLGLSNCPSFKGDNLESIPTMVKFLNLSGLGSEEKPFKFQAPTYLKALHLTNSYCHLDTKNFKRYKSLEYLNLSHSTLQNTDLFKSLKGFSYLEEFYLDENEILSDGFNKDLPKKLSIISLRKWKTLPSDEILKDLLNAEISLDLTDCILSEEMASLESKYLTTNSNEERDDEWFRQKYFSPQPAEEAEVEQI